MNSLHKGQWLGALMLSLICAWINGWVNNHEAGDLRCHHTHYDVTVMRQIIGTEDGFHKKFHIRAKCIITKSGWWTDKLFMKWFLGLSCLRLHNVLANKRRPWEMMLLCDDLSHWLGASLESALKYIISSVIGWKHALNKRGYSWQKAFSNALHKKRYSYFHKNFNCILL